MTSQNELYKIATPLNALVDVIYVHGLDGDPILTWRHPTSQPEDYWLRWLEQARPQVAVYSFGYDAAPVHWLGRSLPLVDRATSLLSLLEARRRHQRPIIWVTHSLGGLIVKQMLRHALDQGVPAWQQIAAQTKAILFFATPHGGANLANWLHRLGRVLGTTVAIDELREHDPSLANLNLWYRRYASNNNLINHCFFETYKTKGVTIVSRNSADLGIEGIIPRPVEANHLDICKPDKASHWLCEFLNNTVDDLLLSLSESTSKKKVINANLDSLPMDNPDFVGRKEFILAIKNALLTGNAQLVALEGMGGIGKTSTAVIAARSLNADGEFPDGIIFINLVD